MDDPDMDLSFLGDFSDSPGKDAIDLSIRPGWRPTRFRYFNPANPYSPEGWEHVSEEEINRCFEALPEEWKAKLPEFTCKAHLVNAFQNEQDCQRLVNYGQTWSGIAVRAEATIEVCGVLQTITSSGLWGIESDSSPEYLAEVGQEELQQLQSILAELGFEGPR